MIQVIGCGCSEALQNFGTSRGNKKFKVPVAVLLQETFNSTGELNGLDLTNPAIKAQILADLNQKDPSKRLFPIVDIDNVEPENEGAQFETMGNGKRKKTREGITTMTLTFANEASHQMFARVDAVCSHVSMYLIDSCGNLLGVKSGNLFSGRRLDKESYNTELETPTNDAVQKIMINFDWYDRNDQKNQWLITAEEIGADFTKVRAMIDVIVNVSAVTTTGATITPKFPFGTALELDVVKGLQLSDIEVFNVTTGLAVTATALTDNQNGTYSPAWSSGVSAEDVVEITVYRAATEFNRQPMLGVDSGQVPA